MFKRNSIKFFFFFVICMVSPMQQQHAVSASKILAVFGLPEPNKYDFVAALLNVLCDRGHQVTLIMRFPIEWDLRENIEKIVVKENQPMLPGKLWLKLHLKEII